MQPTTILLPNREDVLLLHDFILSVSLGRPGILHDKYIDGSLTRPHTYMGYEDVDINTVVALLIDSFGRNHAFNDGNKRTALMCGIYTYAINGVYLEFSIEMNREFEDLVLWVVKSKPSISEISMRLRQLVEKYKQNSFERFASSMRSFFGFGPK